MIRRLFRLAGQVSYRQLLRSPRSELGRIIGWIARRMGRVADVAAHGNPQMPVWLREETIALAHIEPGLLSEYGDLRQYRHYGVPVIPRPGELYQELLQKVGSNRYSHVMILPWLVPGGADRGAIYHLNAWAEVVPAEKILVLTTEPNDSPWAGKIPAGVKMVEFGRLAGEMNFDTQVQLMVRLLVQMQPEVIHNINSRVAWQCIKVAGLALRQRSALFASLFCDDYDLNLVPVGYARSYLRDCFTHMQTIFCDNSVYPRRWSRELGVSESVFSVLPFPYDREWEERPLLPGSASRPRVLWAGRLDRQKRPDILAAIASELPEFDFDVHGVAVVSGGDPALQTLGRLANVHMHGSFKRLEDVVQAAHFAYLHTSAWEGVPTILFDVAAAGLPIVAPNVGGIPDFIEEEWLVADYSDVKSHVAKLKALSESPELRQERRSAQYAQLCNGRSWTAFTERLSGVARYMSAQ